MARVIPTIWMTPLPLQPPPPKPQRRKPTSSGAPWYTYPRIDNIGSPDPYGGFPKPDSNIQLPAGYPVTSLYSGTVTGIDTASSWGCSVTIKLDNPLNALATHTSYLHLAGFASNIGMGSHVSAGQLIGYNGGSSACGAQKVPLGFALYPGDNYGFGAAWQILLSNVTGLLNPVPVLNSWASGQPLAGGPPTQSAGPATGLANCAWYCGFIPGAGTTILIDQCKGCITVSSVITGSASGQTNPFTTLQQQLSGLLTWVGNPVRIVKMAAGILLIGISLLLMISPDAQRIARKAVAFA